MDEERERLAYDRIEAALGRIEAAAGRLPVAPPIDGDLPARHARLREGAASALARIDRLIAAREG